MEKYITILPITLYILFVWHKYGIQKSISEAYYRLTWKQQPYHFISLLSTAFLFIFTTIYLHPKENISNWFMVIAGIGIGYTASAAWFKDSKIVNTVHYLGAMIGYVFGYIYLISHLGFDSVYFIIPSLLIMWGVAEFDKNDKYVWWFEIIAMMAIWGGTLV